VAYVRPSRLRRTHRRRCAVVIAAITNRHEQPRIPALIWAVCSRKRRRAACRATMGQDDLAAAGRRSGPSTCDERNAGYSSTGFSGWGHGCTTGIRVNTPLPYEVAAEVEARNSGRLFRVDETRNFEARIHQQVAPTTSLAGPSSSRTRSRTITKRLTRSLWASAATAIPSTSARDLGPGRARDP